MLRLYIVTKMDIFLFISDRYGFNNPDNEHNSHDIEYFLVGDSFTHGACVNRPNDITSVFKKNIKQKSS